MSWQIAAARVIERCIAENPEVDEPALRKIISAAYPFGERAMWPYKVWLAEVKYQLVHRAVRTSQTMIFPESRL